MTAPTLADTSEIDWALVPLPPCTQAVREGADTGRRRAAVTRAYYAPELRGPDAENPERERRITGGQTVLVAPDGSILATWRSAGRKEAARRRTPAAFPPGPTAQGELLAALSAEGVEWRSVRRHVQVHTPRGGPVYISLAPADEHEVSNTVALLRQHGCTLRHPH